METIDEAFIKGLKSQTEELWKSKKINSAIYGFQIQPGTCWRPGLSETEIDGFQRDLRVEFSRPLKIVLRHINGTDTPNLNVYGNSGESHRTRISAYSYPADLDLVKELIAGVEGQRADIKGTLLEQGFDLKDNVSLVPFYLHRYVVCSQSEENSPVLSITGTDAIVYAPTLRRYLEVEFLT
jgi:hypothetical protein